MEKSKTLDILKQAILLEKRGKAFYTSVAQHTANADVKKIFEIMAAEEEEHLKFLTEQFKKFKLGEKFDVSQLQHEIHNENTEEQILTEKIKNQISSSEYEAAAISASIDMENHAIKIYAERAAHATDINEKVFYAWLADWEREHHKLLFELDEQLKEKIWNDNNFWPF